MKLQILSDLHMEFASFEFVQSDAEVVILAGDIHLGEKGFQWAKENIKNKEVIYVLGNHEFYKVASPLLIEKIREKAKGSHVHLLENESIVINGIRFLGCSLWTDFNLLNDPIASMAAAHLQMNDYKKIRISPKFRKIEPSITAAWHRKSIKWLMKACQEHRDENIVVVTHHAPSMCSIPIEYRKDPLCAAFASDLDAFIASSNIKVWVHGHLHTAYDYFIGQTRVVSNPLGYPDEPDRGFDPVCMVDVQSGEL